MMSDLSAPSADLLDTREAAALLGVSVRKLCWRARHGVIPAVKYPGETGRYVFERPVVEALARQASPGRLIPPADGAASLDSAHSAHGQ